MKEKFEETVEVETNEEDCSKEVIGEATWTKVKRTGKKALKVLGLVSLGVVIGVAGASLGKEDDSITITTADGEFTITEVKEESSEEEA